MKEIINQIKVRCDEVGLEMDRACQPIKVGPDVYMISATRLNESCTRQGYCQEKRYYAIVGKYVVIIENGEVIS